MAKGKYLSNPIRQKLLKQIGIALAAHQQREHAGDMRHYFQAVDFNQEFMDRGRGHSYKGSRFIKSVALQRVNTTYFPPDKRNSQRECSRRSAQA